MVILVPGDSANDDDWNLWWDLLGCLLGDSSPLQLSPQYFPQINDIELLTLFQDYLDICDITVVHHAQFSIAMAKDIWVEIS